MRLLPHIISSLLLLAMSLNSMGQELSLVPQLSHSDSITQICTDDSKSYIFSSDIKGNLKMWDVKSKNLIRDFDSHLSSIDYMISYAFVTTHHLICYSKKDEKISVIDYNQDTLVKSIVWDEAMFGVVLYSTSLGSSDGKRNQTYQILGQKKRALYSRKTFDFLTQIDNGIPYDDSITFTISQYGESIFTAEPGTITFHLISDKEVSKPYTLRLRGNDTKIENLKYINAIRRNQSLLIAGDSNFYLYDLARFTQKRVPRRMKKKDVPILWISKDLDGPTYHYNSLNQIAYLPKANKIVFGELLVDYPNVSDYSKLLFALPRLNYINPGYSNYSEQDLLIGSNKNRIIARNLFDDKTDFYQTKKFGAEVSKVKQLFLDSTGEKLLTQSKFIGSWDLNRANLESSELGYFKTILSSSASDDLSHIALDLNTKKYNAFTYSATEKKILKGIRIKENEAIDLFEMLPNGVGMLYTNTESGKRTNTVYYQPNKPARYGLYRAKDSILEISIDPRSREFVLRTKEFLTRVDLNSYKKVKKLHVENSSNIKYLGSDILFAKGNKIYRWNTNNNKTQLLLSPSYSIRRIKTLDSDIYAVFSDRENVNVYKGNQLVKSFYDKSSGVNDIVYSKAKDRYVIAYDNGVIRIETGSQTVNLLVKHSEVLPQAYTYLFYKNNGTFSGSKGLYELARLRKGNELYSTSNYDLEYNRPYDILTELKSTDEAYLSILKTVEQKRAKKYNYKENIESISGPEITNLNDSSVTVTHLDTLKFLIHIESKDYDIATLDAYVNGVPMIQLKDRLIRRYIREFPKTDSVGMKTTRSSFFDLALMLQNRKDSTVGKNTMRNLRFAWPVALTQGMNTIEFYCTNTQGIKSKVLTYEVKKIDNNPEKPNLYVMALSVSNYADDNYDLRYARKDGRDILNAFKNNRYLYNEMSDDSSTNYLYENVYIDSLFDENATVENLYSISRFFENARPQDIIVLYISGHGVLDEQKDFWFATHDMDFNQPGKNGLSFSSLESQMRYLKSRNRLILMDACHSGEVDKYSDEGEQVVSKGVNSTFKGASVEGNEPTIGLQNSFDLMKELFSDVGRGTGIQVISAAAGNSFALESEEWNNGVFTYCILKGMEMKTPKTPSTISKEDADLNKNGILESSEIKAFGESYESSFFYANADYNQDGEVSIAELQMYVSREVERLTNGLQKPTSRQGNLEFDYRVW